MARTFVACSLSALLLSLTACAGSSSSPADTAPGMSAPPAPAWTEETVFFSPSGERVRLYGVGIYDIDVGDDVSCGGRIVMDATERRGVAELSKALTVEQSGDGNPLITRAAAAVRGATLDKTWFNGRVAYVLVSVPFEAALPGWKQLAPKGGMYRVETEAAIRTAGRALVVERGRCEEDAEKPSACCR